MNVPAGVPPVYSTPNWREAPAIANKYGFCIVEGFFEVAEVERWEALACAVSENDSIKDFLTLPPFDSLVTDRRVLDLARALLGPKVVYYGETTASMGRPPFRVWHCDARGMPKRLGASYEPPPGEIYPGWRFAIYFRDYRTASGGLKVGPGSHLRPLKDLLSRERRSARYTLVEGELSAGAPPFPIYNVQSKPGDLVIFNLRTFHSAGAVLLKENHQAQLMPDIEGELFESYPMLFEPEPPQPRNALFFDFGAPSAAIDLYIKWRAHSIRRDPKLHNNVWERVIRETDLGAYAYDQPARRQAAEAHGLLLRYDRIIMQLLYKKDLLGELSPSDQERLDLLWKINTEFSPYHPLAAS